MRILFADDHDLLRESVAAMAAAEGAADFVTVSDLEAALHALQSDAFDLVLLDYQMPGMNGLEGLQRAIVAAKGVPVAVISGTTRRALAEEALSRGAAGFVPKTLGVKAMIAAMQVMVEGGQFAPLSMLEESPPAGALLEELTRREMDVLRGICQGKSNKEIARDLEVQEVTIKLHVKTLTRKLGARNRTHAAMIARSAGMP